MSYLVSIFFAFGCLIFLICGLISWLPLVSHNTAFQNPSTVGIGVAAFIGATFFQIGGILLLFEACNENQTGCFGWAVHCLFRGNEESTSNNAEREDQILLQKDSSNCTHHHQQRQPKPRQPWKLQNRQPKWLWCPSWNELKTHHFHEIGFIASISLTIGATMFYISAICALPGINNHMSVSVTWGVYWLARLLGAVLFVFSSVLSITETQSTWYTPAPYLLGWHIGVWNLIGSIGWTLSASLRYCSASWCVYQGDLTVVWASAALLIGSLLQMYEALEKHPIETIYYSYIG